MAKGLALAAILAASLTLGAPSSSWGDPARLAFAELYGSYAPTGMTFSAKLTGLVGQSVTMRGYMAPPLKPDARFFVLTREPMAVCPFCNSDADWPLDIVVVYLRRTLAPTDPNQRLTVTGRLELGSWIDPDTGFVSQIRLVDAEFGNG